MPAKVLVLRYEARAGAQEFQNIGHTDAHSANAGASAALSVVDRYSGCLTILGIQRECHHPELSLPLPDGHGSETGC